MSNPGSLYNPDNNRNRIGKYFEFSFFEEAVGGIAHINRSSIYRFSMRWEENEFVEAMVDSICPPDLIAFTEEMELKYGVHDCDKTDANFDGFMTYEVEGDLKRKLVEEWRGYYASKGIECGETTLVYHSKIEGEDQKETVLFDITEDFEKSSAGYQCNADDL